MGRPIIGITTAIEENNMSLRPHYIEAVTDLGGVPLLLAKNDDEQSIKEQIEVLDGLYLTGGNDINPSTYNEEPHPKLEKVEHGRDEYEIEVIKHAFKRGIPILGICRGSQLLNSLTDGTMYQDLEAQYEGEDLIQHKQKSNRDYLQHSVLIEGSRLHKIVGTDKIRVNSHHHQANKDVDNKDFIVSGRAPDGVIEALEGTGNTFIMGLQFHPEDSYKFDEPSKKILEAFLSEAQQFRAEKR
ncbi:gamma-glutamyl-gamma-aminobutyrate hydrolase family protein [Jeotgalicoccus sp. WY2]|uniref:gamma-glutamyl-gamma-aminobutyrate hydrolase family protein n=1 Tax=Jeotgalicoccus sp. WY2 TaxID=2708346 RepID=UPI001BD1CB12|nr:gamma-glutamyl-gamma-aminobutyrate hydrolase family protein [Jeotgalicoccus sp. WY2]